MFENLFNKDVKSEKKIDEKLEKIKEFARESVIALSEGRDVEISYNDPIEAMTTALFIKAMFVNDYAEFIASKVQIEPGDKIKISFKE